MLRYTDLLAYQEHYKDLLQEVERERLIRAGGLRHSANWKLPRRVADWIGAQMVSWGYKLQHYGTAPSPCCPQVAECQ